MFCFFFLILIHFCTSFMSRTATGEHKLLLNKGFPGGASGKNKQQKKNPPADAGDVKGQDSIPQLGRSTGGGRGNPLQYSCLEKPLDRGA